MEPACAERSCLLGIESNGLDTVDLLANGVQTGKHVLPMAEELDGMATFVAVPQSR
jgi:hypothetical protein